MGLMRLYRITVCWVSNPHTEIARVNETRSPSSGSAHSLVRGDRLHSTINLLLPPDHYSLAEITGLRKHYFWMVLSCSLCRNSGNHPYTLCYSRCSVGIQRFVIGINKWVSCSSKAWEYVCVSHSPKILALWVTVTLGRSPSLLQNFLI